MSSIESNALNRAEKISFYFEGSKYTSELLTVRDRDNFIMMTNDREPDAKSFIVNISADLSWEDNLYVHEATSNSEWLKAYGGWSSLKFTQKRMKKIRALLELGADDHAAIAVVVDPWTGELKTKELVERFKKFSETGQRLVHDYKTGSTNFYFYSQVLDPLDQQVADWMISVAGSDLRKLEEILEFLVGATCSMDALYEVTKLSLEGLEAFELFKRFMALNKEEKVIPIVRMLAKFDDETWLRYKTMKIGIRSETPLSDVSPEVLKAFPEGYVRREDVEYLMEGFDEKPGRFEWVQVMAFGIALYGYDPLISAFDAIRNDNFTNGKNLTTLFTIADYIAETKETANVTDWMIALSDLSRVGVA